MVRFVAVFLAVILPYSAQAEPVVLTTFDRALEVEGELLSFDGSLFRIRTADGELTLEAGGFYCQGAGCPNENDLVSTARVEGPADMVHRLFPALLEGFAAKHGWTFRKTFVGDDHLELELLDSAGIHLARIDALVRSDDQAMAHLIARQADIALGRSPGGRRNRSSVIALDGLVPAVAPDNPRVMLTANQLRGLLEGRILNWAALGGQDLPVALHLPSDAQVISQIQRVLPGLDMADAQTHREISQMADVVANDATALGLVPVSMIGNAVPLVIGGPCGLATPATASTIKSRDYPLTQPLFLHRAGVRQPKIIRDFIGYVTNHEAQSFVRGAGFIDLSIGRVGFERQGDRLANAVLAAGSDGKAVAEVQRMISALVQGERLTVAFRFQDGSSELDAQSSANVLHLADAISRGEFKDRELVFVGFSDGIGDRTANQRLSARRAKVVRNAVSAQSADQSVLYSFAGFGEAMPMACDSSAWGREINRRVEVWVR